MKERSGAEFGGVKSKKEIDVLCVREEIITERKEIRDETAKYIKDLGRKGAVGMKAVGMKAVQYDIPKCPKNVAEDETDIIGNIQEEEMKEAIQKLQREKAVGLDDIPNEFIIEGGSVYGHV